MRTIAHPNSKVAGQGSAQKFIRFRVSDELWRRVNIFKVLNSTSLEQICTEALTRYLKDNRDAK
jgi:hypothetical protein